MAIADFVQALDSTDEIQLGTIGRVSGKQSSRPVWFVHEGDSLFFMPITGADSHWYRNVLETPELHLAADGAQADVQGRPITDPDSVQRVADGFRAKYGSGDVAQHYREPEVAVEVRLS
jgi:hypothetical protein